MLRRLIDPITLWPEPRPNFIRWEAPTKAVGLLDGIEDAPSIWLASPTGSDGLYEVRVVEWFAA